VRSVTELIVHIADLCEAEGCVLRAMVVRLVLGMALVIVATILITGGAALLLAAIFIAVQGLAGPAVAALVTGLIALGIGGIFTWLGRRMGT